MRKGFSLAEVLIAAVLLGLMSIALVSMINNSLKGRRNVQNGVDADMIKNSINMIVKTKACEGAFKNKQGQPVRLNLKSPRPASGDALALAADIQKISDVAEVGSTLQGGLSIKSMKFISAKVDGTQTVAPLTYDRFVATIRVSFTKAQDSMGGTGFDADFVARVLAVQASGDVVSCQTLEEVQATSNGGIQLEKGVVPSALWKNFLGSGVGGFDIPNPFPGISEVDAKWYLCNTAPDAGYPAGTCLSTSDLNGFNNYMIFKSDAAKLYFHARTYNGFYASDNSTLFVPKPNKWELRYTATAPK